MEFEIAFSRPGKVMDFRKNGRGHGKIVEFHFLSKYFVLFENWKHSPCHRAKKAGISVFLSHGKFELVIESQGKAIEFFCVIAV